MSNPPNLIRNWPMIATLICVGLSGIAATITQQYMSSGIGVGCGLTILIARACGRKGP